MPRDTPSCGFEVGKFYRVPCIKTVAKHRWDRLWRGEWVPVMGPEHRDDGAVNFPLLHWHVDWRFASARLWNRLTAHSIYGESGAFHHVVTHYPSTGKFGGELELEPFVQGEVELKRRKCLRPLPTYPLKLAQWMPKLNEECAHLKLKNMVCPHRGLPLKGCPQDGDVVTCPGHGLRWNVKTGELVHG